MDYPLTFIKKFLIPTGEKKILFLISRNKDFFLKKQRFTANKKFNKQNYNKIRDVYKGVKERVFDGKEPLLTSFVVYLLSCVWLFATAWTVTCQAPLSVGFSRQEYWSGYPFPSPGDLPDPGIKPMSPVLQVDSLPLSHQGMCQNQVKS